MTTIPFDTLRFVETLKDAGFDEKQAKGMVVAIQDVQKSSMDELATKQDLKELEARLDMKIAETKADMIKWMFGVAAGQAMFIITFLKVFPSH